jgi:hypothetical protein
MPTEKDALGNERITVRTAGKELSDWRRVQAEKAQGYAEALGEPSGPEQQSESPQQDEIKKTLADVKAMRDELTAEARAERSRIAAETTRMQLESQQMAHVIPGHDQIRAHVAQAGDQAVMQLIQGPVIRI